MKTAPARANPDSTSAIAQAAETQPKAAAGSPTTKERPLVLEILDRGLILTRILKKKNAWVAALTILLAAWGAAGFPLPHDPGPDDAVVMLQDAGVFTDEYGVVWRGQRYLPEDGVIHLPAEAMGSLITIFSRRSLEKVGERRLNFLSQQTIDVPRQQVAFQDSVSTLTNVILRREGGEILYAEAGQFGIPPDWRGEVAELVCGSCQTSMWKGLIPRGARLFIKVKTQIARWPDIAGDSVRLRHANGAVHAYERSAGIPYCHGDCGGIVTAFAGNEVIPYAASGGEFHRFFSGN